MAEAPDALLARAAAHYGAGELDAAARCGLDIVRQAPEHFDALHLLGVICLHRGQAADATCYFTRAARVAPDHVQLHVNRGNAAQALKLYADAAAIFRRVLATNPDNVAAMNNLGIALTDDGRAAEAVDVLQAALARDPRYAAAYFNLGKALLALDRSEEAAAAYRGALLFLAPDDQSAQVANIASGLAQALLRLDRAEEALALYADLIVRSPDQADLAWNHSLLLLCIGDYAAGWRAYESRWLVEAHDRPRLDASVPDLVTVAGKRILLTHEQGRGDMIQFIRYAPLLAARGATVFLSVYDDLYPLMSHIPGIARVVGEDEHVPDYDIVTPLLSLPYAFGTTLESVPRDVPYLHADPTRVASWRVRLGAEPGLKIGLTWASTNPGADRSTRLEVLRPLLACEGVAFHALQTGITAGDLTFLRQHGGIAEHRRELTNFAETAALIEALDLVISIDTAVAHLAGALGKPVWIMLPHTAEWRWLRHRADSPWYPTAVLFRQSAPGDWDGLVARIVAAVAGITD